MAVHRIEVPGRRTSSRHRLGWKQALCREPAWTASDRTYWWMSFCPDLWAPHTYAQSRPRSVHRSEFWRVVAAKTKQPGPFGPGCSRHCW